MIGIDISLYPNPTKENITISLKTSMEIFNLKFMI